MAVVKLGQTETDHAPPCEQPAELRHQPLNSWPYVTVAPLLTLSPDQNHLRGCANTTRWGALTSKSATTDTPSTIPDNQRARPARPASVQVSYLLYAEGGATRRPRCPRQQAPARPPPNHRRFIAVSGPFWRPRSRSAAPLPTPPARVPRPAPPRPRPRRADGAHRPHPPPPRARRCRRRCCGGGGRGGAACKGRPAGGQGAASAPSAQSAPTGCSRKRRHSRFRPRLPPSSATPHAPQHCPKDQLVPYAAQWQMAASPSPFLYESMNPTIPQYARSAIRAYAAGIIAGPSCPPNVLLP